MLETWHGVGSAEVVGGDSGAGLPVGNEKHPTRAVREAMAEETGVSAHDP
jgi:hypothetical protein